MMELELLFGSLNCLGRCFLIGLSVCVFFFFLFVVPNNFFGRVKDKIIVFNTQEFATQAYFVALIVH